MQRMPGARRADRAPFGGTDTTGLLRLAERDVYVTLRRTVRTLPSGRGRVRHAWIARTPARYPTGAGRTGTPSPESPYVPRRFRSRRPDWVRMMRLSAPANTGRTEQYAGRLTLSGRRPSRGRPKRQGPASIHETGPCLCGRQVGAGGGSAPTSRSGGLGLDLGTVTFALPKFPGNRRSSDRRRLSPASMARPRPDGRRANAGGRATTRSTRKAARLRSVRCRSAS
jgi:hypothetical protein